MTTRNIKAVIEVGGQVAASLPSATRRARAELKSLEDAQRGDVAQLRTLRQSLSYVAEGSESYNRRQQEIAQTQERLDFRTDKIVGARDALKGAGTEAGGFRGRLMQVRGVLGPVGIAVGAATGLIVGLAAAFRGAGRQANELTNTAALYGQTVEGIQQRRNLFQYFTQDAGRAQAAARNLLDISEQFQRVQFGAGAGADQFLAANRLGFNPADLIRGNLDQRQILEQAIAGAQGLGPVEARLRLEQAGFSEDVRAAVLIGTKDGLGPALAYQQRQAVLSEEQLNANRDMGRNIDEMLTQVRRLVQVALSGIAPPLLSMSSAILKWLGGPEGELRAEEQELGFRRGEVEERRDAELETYRRAAERNPIDAPLPESAPFQAANRELAAIEMRLAQIPGELQRLQDIDLSGQYPGPLGNLPGTEQLAERGVSAGDIARFVVDPVGAALRGLAPQIPSALPIPGVTPRRLGGRVRPGEVTLVGEEGPEVARFPAGTEVLPASIPDVGVRAPSIPDVGVRIPSIPDVGVRAPSIPDVGVRIPSIPDVGVRAPSIPDVGVRIPSIPDVGVRAPSIPDVGVRIPSIPDVGVRAPSIPDVGVRIPSIPDVGVRAPSIPDVGVRIPSIPDVGVRAPSIPDVGVRIPSIPDVGVRAPSIPAQTAPGQDLASQLKSAFAQALGEAGFAGGQPTTYNQTITQNITNNSGDDIAQKLVDAQAQNPPR